METDSTRALPSEVKILNKPNKPAFQGGLRLQLVKFKTGKQPWCLKPMVQHCWLPLELQRCHCAPKSPAANRGVVLLYWEQASKAQEPLYRIMQELKANTFSSLMMPPFFSSQSVLPTEVTGPECAFVPMKPSRCMHIQGMWNHRSNKAQIPSNGSNYKRYLSGTLHPFRTKPITA